MAEAPAILMHRRGSFLVPHGPMDAEAIEGFPVNKPLRVRITQPRNVGRMRLYWATLRVMADNMENPPPLETLHAAVKMRLGLTTPIRFKGGETVDVPRSVAFDQMSEQEFNQFFQSFKDLVRSNPAMEKAAREMLGDD